MRSSIILGALALASSVFAAPGQKQNVSDILDRVDKTLEAVNDNLGKRNPQVDLDGIVDTVTDTVNGLVGTLDGLLNVSPHCLLSLPCLISDSATDHQRLGCRHRRPVQGYRRRRQRGPLYGRR